MSLVRDQSGGHEAEGAGVDSIRPAAERQRQYQFTCLNCGAQNAGKIEDGCTQSGAGRGGVMKGPEPAVDFTCSACRGGGKVERKCVACGGTGNINHAIPGQEPIACLTCGGGGAVAMDCARCQGTGIDPHPQPKEAPVATVPSDSWIAEQKDNAERERQKMTAPLPSLDDPQPGAALPVQVRRYLVVEIVGGAEMADYLAETLLANHDGKYCRRRAVEIAPSPTTDRLFKQP